MATKRNDRPLNLTPEQLDLAAEVTSVDVAVARSMWQQWAPPKFVDLLEAVSDDAERV